MINKNIIYILLFILISNSTAYAYDFYPEMGVDPFYSSLNPAIIPEQAEEKNFDSVITLFKKKQQQRKEEKLLKKQLKEEQKQQQEAEKLQKAQTKEDTEFSKKSGAEKVIDLEKEEKEKEKTSKQNSFIGSLNSDKNLTEEKKPTLKERLSFKKKTNKQNEEKIVEDPKIELTAEYMEYFPDRYEVEAVGNAKVKFTKEDVVLSANKIVFNYDRNILKANENVVLLSNGTITEGDFIKIDLSKPDGWIENPITTTDDIKLTAKEAFVYSDKIEQYDGVAKILKNETLAFRANSFASYVDRSGIIEKNNKKQTKEGGVYSLKAKTIYIDSRKDHEVITIKNADLYLKKYRIAAIPSARIVSNKQNTVIESNIPEVGSQSLLGAHIGPAVVLNVPGGSTLKLAPILTYSDDKFGIGGIARYRNQYNMTEVAYGTSKDELLIRGRQQLAPGLRLNYSRLTNQNEWFLGFRKPKYSADLTYSRSDYVKDLKLHFSQMYTAGLFVDYVPNAEFKDAEARFRWMTQAYKPIYNYKNEEGNIGFGVGLVSQTAASVYTTGDVLGLFRIGPMINTKVGPWNQAIMYYQTAEAGQSPFTFDRYRYGNSNVILVESLRICKYLTVGYLASLAMNREVKSDDLFQENRFLVSFGPDYARITIGYDAYRQNTMLILSMLVGTKDSEIEFKKSVLHNPEKFGKKQVKKKTPKKNYKKYLKETK